MTIKCVACHKDKPLDQFHKHYSNKSGRQKVCKECAHLYQMDNVNRLIHKLQRHHLTLDEYHSMVESQDFVCAICENAPEINKQNLVDGFVIDHNHKTNKVRKLLCPSCNAAVGMVKENISIAKSLVRYVEVISQ